MAVSLDIEEELWVRGIGDIAGVDEAGRGPLAGPVVAAAVIFPRGIIIPGVDDSKKLTARRREELVDEIRSRAVSWSVGIVGHEAIDEINILEATLRAMEEAIAALTTRPRYLLVDGNRFHRGPIPYKTVVDGDALSFTIAAASIIAKVTRDHLMVDLDSRYPEYGFARHKGYGTKEHLAAIRKHGLSPVHRKTFRVKSLETG